MMLFSFLPRALTVDMSFTILRTVLEQKVVLP